MKNKTDIISSASIFDGLPEKELESLAGIAVEKRFQRGEIIFTEGDPGDGFYIVASGKVKIYKLSPDGKEQILHIFGAGEPFGEVPVFSGESFPATAEALQKSLLLFFPRSSFIDLITKNPSLSMNMLGVLAYRLRRFATQVESLSLKEVPARLAAYLIFLSREQESQEHVSLDISKGQLASLLGTIPETLSRILTRMASQKLIEVLGKNIRLLDVEALEELAAHGKETK